MSQRKAVLIWLLFAASARSYTDAFEAKKKGVHVCPFLRYGSLLEGAQIPLTAGFTNYMKKNFKCPTCGGDFKFTLDDVTAHTKECQAKKQQNDEEEARQREELQRAGKWGKEEETAPTVSGPTAADAVRTQYYCPACLSTLQLTPTEIIKHKRSHAHTPAPKTESAPVKTE